MKNMTGMNHPTEPTLPATAEQGAHDMSAMGGMEGMGAKPRLSTLNLVIVSVLSMAMLATGFALAAHYGDLSMRSGDSSMKMPQTNAPMSDKPMKGMKMPAN